jgi:CheY-like chemotaxis protein
MAKSIARIAIVDDQLQDFPINDLKSDGYQVQTYRHVQLANIQSLASYDIVFLDMKGIVKDDPDYGGLKLIAELRKLNPQQKICAVSGQTFDPTATEFFKQADDYKKKPLTAQECKTVIDSFIVESFDPSKLAAQARGVLGAVSRSARVEVISAIRALVDGGHDLQRLADRLVRLGIDRDSRAPLLALEPIRK